MSARKKKSDDEALSVAQAMQLVRWDFAPEDDGSALEVSTGAFFEEFPWEGDEESPAKSTKKPKDDG